jgi:antitoxin YefM
VWITASLARKEPFPPIKKANEDHGTVEIVSMRGNAVLISAEDYTALGEGACLLRPPANARWLLKSYENARNGIHVAAGPGQHHPLERNPENLACLPISGPRILCDT